MKKTLLILLFLPMIGFTQYSNYYNIDANINKKVRVSGTVNQNINVSGTVTNTITTIDYGALANANAQRESNRLTQQKIALEQAKYRNEKERKYAISEVNRGVEISNNPSKAHAYGNRKTLNYSYKNVGWNSLRFSGFFSYDEVIVVPHVSLFQNVGAGRWENVSSDGITTEVMGSVAEYNYQNFPILSFKQAKNYSSRIELLLKYYLNNKKPRNKDYKKDKDSYKKALKRYEEVCDSIDNFGFVESPKSRSQMNQIEEKVLFLDNGIGDSIFPHKKEVVKRLVYGHQGFRYTLIWEDDYGIYITDNYYSLYNGISSSVRVRYKADKASGLTFEDLEGRRFYLSQFIDKTIASRIIKNEVFATLDKNKPKRRNYSNSEDFEKAYKKWYDRLIEK